ncbi:hypothetical protein [Rhodococcoides yunnanense]|uniref:hypothetical protein n=1 Tax=Rhodococcoides yunnanense TaxID=278209 RepID=UPI0009346DC3|nr:hypothetical protein [Rhodococcus yunnanensis]
MGSTLVLGTSGGAGTTTTTVGLANVTARQGLCAVAVDATVGGGDLVERAADGTVRPTTVESGYIDSFMSVASTGAQVLGRAWPQASEPDYDRLDWYLRSRTDARFYDLGHTAFGRHSAHPLRSQPSVALVLVVQARRDAVHRTRTALQSIALTAGRKVLSRTTVVLTHQHPGVNLLDAGHFRHCLDDVVFAVDEIPYDSHLATGWTVTASALEPTTTQAFERLRATTLRSTSGTLSA